MSTDVYRSHVDTCADYEHKRILLIIWHIRSMLRLSARRHITNESNVSWILRWHQVAKESSGNVRHHSQKKLNPLLSHSLDKGSTYFNASNVRHNRNRLLMVPPIIQALRIWTWNGIFLNSVEKDEVNIMLSRRRSPAQWYYVPVVEHQLTLVWCYLILPGLLRKWK